MKKEIDYTEEAFLGALEASLDGTLGPPDWAEPYLDEIRKMIRLWFRFSLRGGTARKLDE